MPQARGSWSWALLEIVDVVVVLQYPNWRCHGSSDLEAGKSFVQHKGGRRKEPAFVVSRDSIYFCRRRRSAAPPNPSATSVSVAGSGTGPTCPRISPPGKTELWMFVYALPAIMPLTNAASAPAAVPPPKPLRNAAV